MEKSKEMAPSSHLMKATKVNGKEILNMVMDFTKIFQLEKSTMENTAITNPTETASSQNGIIHTTDNSNQANELGKEFR